MNLKERGITIGDLLIILIIILTTTVLVKSLKKEKKATFNHSNNEQIYNDKTPFSNFNLDKLSS